MRETTETNAKQGELCVPNLPKEKNSMEHRTAIDREIRAQVSDNKGKKHVCTQTTGRRKVSRVLKYQGRRTVTERDKRNGERSTATMRGSKRHKRETWKCLLS